MQEIYPPPGTPRRKFDFPRGLPSRRPEPPVDIPRCPGMNDVTLPVAQDQRWLGDQLQLDAERIGDAFDGGEGWVRTAELDRGQIPARQAGRGS